MILLLMLLLAPGDVDEVAALEAAVANAMKAVEPSVVTIETVGGVRPADLPGNPRDKMTLPERPRDGKGEPKEGEPKEEEPAPEGRTPRFGDEFKKMLALPGFQKAEGPTTGVILSADGYVVTSAWNFESRPTVITVRPMAIVLRLPRRSSSNPAGICMPA